jgi:hypothetical protein
MVQCLGNKKDGARCTRSNTFDSIFCWQHKEICDEKEVIIKIQTLDRLSTLPISRLITRTSISNNRFSQSLEPNILKIINYFTIIPEGVSKLFTLPSDKKWQFIIEKINKNKLDGNKNIINENENKLDNIEKTNKSNENENKLDNIENKLDNIDSKNENKLDNIENKLDNIDSKNIISENKLNHSNQTSLLLVKLPIPNEDYLNKLYLYFVAKDKQFILDNIQWLILHKIYFNEMYLIWAQKSSIEDLSKFMIFLYINKFFDLFYLIFHIYKEKCLLLQIKSIRFFLYNEKKKYGKENLINYLSIFNLVYMDFIFRKNVFIRKKSEKNTDLMLQYFGEEYYPNYNTQEKSIKIYLSVHKFNNKEKIKFIDEILHSSFSSDEDKFLYEIYKFIGTVNYTNNNKKNKSVSCIINSFIHWKFMDFIQFEFRNNLNRTKKPENRFRNFDISEPIKNQDIFFLKELYRIISKPEEYDHWYNKHSDDITKSQTERFQKQFQNYLVDKLEEFSMLEKLSEITGN